MVMDFMILTDTRQQKEKHIIKVFDKNKILHVQTKLDSADYMAIRYDNGFYKDYSILIDTKKDLLEMCGNLARSTEHARIIREIELGRSLGCQDFIFLIGEDNIHTIDDIKKWSNKHTKVSGATLFKIMTTFKEHHNVRFMIVPKQKMGEVIINLLSKK